VLKEKELTPESRKRWKGAQIVIRRREKAQRTIATSPKGKGKKEQSLLIQHLKLDGFRS